ncbi:MAG: dihydroorotate dehydrogenase electron transfer subunit [Kiritimatiellia bacterium]
MQDITAHVRSLDSINADYRCLLLHAPEIAHTARPGQFIHLRVTGLEPSALRRPFSIYHAAGDLVSVLYKTVGRGTEQLSRLRAGDTLSVMGPLGNGFPIETGCRTPILVAGGYGVAPLVFLARHLPTRGIVMIGGRTAADILCADDFIDLGWEVRIATLDGSRGTTGLVTVLLDDWFARHAMQPATFYACGPDGMLRAVGERATRTGAHAWLSLDKHMVCGVGACLACVQRLRRPDGTTWIARVCRDGPVFAAQEIAWEEHG